MSGQDPVKRYRSTIERGLRAALAREGALARIGRYHIGLEDEQGQSSAAFGKFLRPAIALFVAEDLGGHPEGVLPAALGLELIHSFSLVHDDIQDQDETRRGRPAVWTLWGVYEAINAGDYLHALATDSALRAGAQAAAELTRATASMIEGQSLDLSFEMRFVGEEEYVEMVDRKTGALFSCAFALGGICAGANEDVLVQLRSLGRSLGRAFQIQDDALGIWGDGEAFGKPIGSDIRRRKKSYPLAAVHPRTEGEQQQRLEAIYADESVSDEDVAWVVELMEGLGVRADVERAVDRHSSEAAEILRALPFSDAGQEELEALIERLARRDR